MAYFVATLITLFITIIETSLLPFFQIFGAVPFVFLAFLSLLSVRYQGIFHIFIAFIAGLFFDAVSSGFPGVFTIVFISNAMIGRTFFYKDTGYNSTQSFYILLGTSAVILYVIQGIGLLLSGDLIWWDFGVVSLIGVILTLITGFVVMKYLETFVEWLNKKAVERFR